MREVRCDVMRCDSQGWQGFNPEIVCPSLLLGDVLPGRLHLPSRLSLLSRLFFCRQSSLPFPFSTLHPCLCCKWESLSATSAEFHCNCIRSICTVNTMPCCMAESQEMEGGDGRRARCMKALYDVRSLS